MQMYQFFQLILTFSKLQPEPGCFWRRCPSIGDLETHYTHIVTAFSTACSIAKISRSTIADSPSAFVYQQTQLEEHISRIDKFRARSNALASWPVTPGTVFSWFAGDSALEVALV